MSHCLRCVDNLFEATAQVLIKLGRENVCPKPLPNTPADFVG